MKNVGRARRSLLVGGKQLFKPIKNALLRSTNSGGRSPTFIPIVIGISVGTAILH